MKVLDQKLGGKEAGLIELQEYAEKFGYSVPEFLVIQDGSFAEIEYATRHFFGMDIIVRSNSIQENKENGFDGIYESHVVRDCNLEKLKNAYNMVMDSLYSTKALDYRKSLGIEEDTMRVIVHKFVGRVKGSSEHYKVIYGVMETSINAQGDSLIAYGNQHDTVTSGGDAYEVIFSSEGELLTGTGEAFSVKKMRSIGKNLHKIFGPISLEFACYPDAQEVLLLQKRSLPADMYEAKPALVPQTYSKDKILFSSSLYRGGGAFVHKPIITMPTVGESVNSWQSELVRRASKTTDGYILFVESMHIGLPSLRVLYDYECLRNALAIITEEDISPTSHAFKVAMIAKLPFVSVSEDVDMFRTVKSNDVVSLFFTENEAILYLDVKRQIKNLPKSQFDQFTSDDLSNVRISFNEENKGMHFEVRLKDYSFDRFEQQFHRLLEDVTNETWLIENPRVGTLGFTCINAKNEVISFSGSANYMAKVGDLSLDNFKDHFKVFNRTKNKIPWSLFQELRKHF